jgi:hypothetical protein
MEFMFSYKRRLAELQGPLAGDFLALAEKYKVPKVHVEKYLSDPWMEAFKRFCT